ncbi:MAG: hypothetical protein NTV62_00730 [Candidatus Gribaldobacteria bacterium]|nr:hypothetical protein [Candidatus Gribaldobacteria bacterium]
MSKGGVFTPEGFIMLAIAGFLDFMMLICIVLTAAFGIGVIIGKIVYVFGLAIITPWQMSRYGILKGKKATKKGGASVRVSFEKMKKKFVQKQLGRLAFKIIPILGDFYPPCWHGPRVLEGQQGESLA